MDNLTKQQRRRCMRANKRAGTRPELIVPYLFRNLDFGYQPKMHGHPDFADIKKKVVIFIDGCFWHKCPLHFKPPKTNTEYWLNKINKNVERDKAVTAYYKSIHWRVIRMYEHEVKNLYKNKFLKRHRILRRRCTPLNSMIQQNLK